MPNQIRGYRESYKYLRSPDFNTTAAILFVSNSPQACGLLTRETDNRFDERAVWVDWQEYKPGYIPRLDNAAVSQLLDR